MSGLLTLLDVHVVGRLDAALRPGLPTGLRPGDALEPPGSGGGDSGSDDSGDGDGEAIIEPPAEGLTWVDFAISGGVLVVGIALAVAIRKAIQRRFGSAEQPRAVVGLGSRFVELVLITLAIFYALSNLGVRLGPLLGALGVGGLALALATQSVLTNLVASIILQLRRPIRRGDEVRLGETEGTVVDINFRTVVVRGYDGLLTYVPCTTALDSDMVNVTRRGVRRTTLVVGLPYDADLAEGRRLALEAVQGVEGVHEQPAPEVWLTEFADSSINLDIRFWHEPRQREMFRVRSEVVLAVKAAYDGAGIEIPFPQRTLTFGEAVPLGRRPADDGAGGG